MTRMIVLAATLCIASMARAQPAPELDYATVLEGHVAPRWRAGVAALDARQSDPRYREPALATELAMMLNLDGEILRVDITRGSGLKGFDDAVVELMRTVAPFPMPTSRALSELDGQAHLRWTVDRKRARVEVGLERLPFDEAVDQFVRRGEVEAAVQRLREGWRAEPAAASAALRRVVEALLKAAASSNKPAIRQAAAEPLGELDNGEDALLRLAVDPIASVRGAALQALGARSRSPKALELLSHSLEGEHAAVAVASLNRLGARAQIVDMLSKLLAGDAEHQARALSIGALVPDPSLVPAVLATIKLGSDDYKVQAIGFIEAAARPPTAEVTNELIRLALHDSTPVVRARAYTALATYPDHSAAMRARFIDALADPEARVRLAVSAGLVKVGGAIAFDEITRASRDPNAAVRVAVARALVQSPFEGSARICARLAADREPRVRAALAPPAPATEKPAAPAAEAVPAEALAERIVFETEPTRRLATITAWLRLRRGP